MKPSKSPDRNTFQLNAYLDRCATEGEEPSEAYIELYKGADKADEEWASQSNHDNDMEWDMRTSEWMLKKVRESEAYAQNLYAAMCNNEFQKKEVFQILANQICSYSWRYAGGIIADMRQEGDYIDWYCSGIKGDWSDEEFHNATKEDRERYLYTKNNFVSESVVTDEIRDDLLTLGWVVMPQEDDE